jgi:cell division protein FtsA
VKRSREPGALIAGLDVGTSLVKVVVAEREEGGVPMVIGMGTAESGGMRRGVVVHSESVAASIREAIGEAELTAGVRIDGVSLALSGAHIQGLNSRGIVAVAGRAHQIAADDIQRAVDAAVAVVVPNGREILQVIPQDFVVDDQDGVIDPAGMMGARLEANVHIVTGNPASIQNLSACVEGCGLSIDTGVLGHLAGAQAVLSEDEKRLGVALIDIGGGTTSVSIFERGTMCHSAVLPLGGDHLTTDLAITLRTPIGEAERVKRRYARACAMSLDDETTIPVIGIGCSSARDVPRRFVSDVVCPWIQDLLDRVWDEIRRARSAERLAAGVVVTGGSAVLGSLPDTIESMFAVPARRASPAAAGCVADLVNVPSFSTAVGVAIGAATTQPAASVTPLRARPAARAGRLLSLLRARL